MDLAIEMIFVQVSPQYLRKRCGYSLAVQILYPTIRFTFRQGNGQTATGKSQTFNDLQFMAFFLYHILPDNPHICDLVKYILGDIIIPKEYSFQWKVPGS